MRKPQKKSMESTMWNHIVRHDREFFDDEYRWFYQKMVEWAEKNIRKYPWRKSGDSYRVFLSELLLRRTDRKAVNRIFDDLLAKHPDIDSLISSPSLGNEIKPLGLNRQREKLIRESSKYVKENYGGEIPREINKLLKIPGIGEYSSRAISCFDFGKVTPIIDSNVRRILKRFAGLEEDEIMFHYLSLVIYGRECTVFNYGLIDLGGLVCKPKRPTCSLCPLKAHCKFIENV